MTQVNHREVWAQPWNLTAVNPFTVIHKAESLTVNYGTTVKIETEIPDRDSPFAAYYSVTDHLITLPKPCCFDSSEAFYHTLFHELIHSTGHFELLRRASLYAQGPKILEELTAELGAQVLSSLAGIYTEQIKANSQRYLECWANRGSKFDITVASYQAEQAVKFIINY